MQSARGELSRLASGKASCSSERLTTFRHCLKRWASNLVHVVNSSRPRSHTLWYVQPTRLPFFHCPTAYHRPTCMSSRSQRGSSNSMLRSNLQATCSEEAAPLARKAAGISYIIFLPAFLKVTLYIFFVQSLPSRDRQTALLPAFKRGNAPDTTKDLLTAPMRLA